VHLGSVVTEGHSSTSGETLYCTEGHTLISWVIVDLELSRIVGAADIVAGGFLRGWDEKT